MPLLLTPLDEAVPNVRVKRASSWDDEYGDGDEPYVERHEVKRTKVHHVSEEGFFDLGSGVNASLGSDSDSDEDLPLNARQKTTGNAQLHAKDAKNSSIHDTTRENLQSFGVEVIEEFLAERTSATTITSAFGSPRFVRLVDFNLFGIEALQVGIQTLHVRDVELYHKELGEVPIYLMAKMEKSISLGDIIEWARGTPVGAIKLEDLEVVYQNVQVDMVCPVGLTLSATITVDKSHSELNDLFSKLLGVEQPILNLACNLPTLPDWKAPLSPSSFTFTASLDDLAAKPFDALTIRSVGLSIHGYTGFVFDNEVGNMAPKRMYVYTVHGAMDIALPLAEEKIVKASFSLTKSGSSYQFVGILELDWDNAFGFNGLKLQGVNMNGRIDTSVGWKSASIGLGCRLSIAGTTVHVQGQFTFTGEFDIYFSLSNLTWETIHTIHQQLFPDDPPLDTPDLDLSVESVEVRISSYSGLSFRMSELKLGDYLGASASFAINKQGALFEIEIEGDILKFGEFEITKARLSAEIAFGDRSSTAVAKSGKTYSLTAAGRSKWKSLDVKVGARLYKMAGVDGLQYTIYGDLTDTEGGFRIGDHIPGIEQTPLADITLKKVILLVASRKDDHPSLGLPVGYEVSRGVQLAIEIGACQKLCELFDTKDMGLLMAVSWNPTSPLGISALLKTQNLPKLKIGDNFETGDVQLILDMTPVGPALSFKVDGTLTLHGDKKPNAKKDKLKFELKGTLDATSVSIEGTMKGDWVNPFDLSPKMTIGPELSLGLGISYAGVPDKFGFKGGIKIGKVSAQVDVQASKDPKKQVVKIDCENLDLTDLIKLMDGSPHAPATAPENIVFFKKLYILVCPFGTDEYPRGFIFDCDGTFFNKDAHVYVKITDAGLEMLANVDPFNLGPFRISGAEGSSSKVRGDLYLTMDKQKGSLSGMIQGEGLNATIKGDFTMYPLKIDFKFDLNFFDLFVMKATLGPLPAAPGAVVKAGASMLETGMRLEALYQDHHLQEVLRMVAREWHRVVLAEIKVQRREVVQKLLKGLKQEGFNLDEFERIFSTQLERLMEEDLSRYVDDLVDLLQITKIHVKADVLPGATRISFEAYITGTLQNQSFVVSAVFVFNNLPQLIRNWVEGLKRDLQRFIDDIVQQITNRLERQIYSLSEKHLEQLKPLVQASQQYKNDPRKFGEALGGKEFYEGFKRGFLGF